jgi:hypothetical protein
MKEEQLRVHAFVGDLAFAIERLLGGERKHVRFHTPLSSTL